MKKTITSLLCALICLVLLNSCDYASFVPGNPLGGTDSDTSQNDSADSTPVYDSPDVYDDGPSGDAYYIEFVCNGGSSLNTVRA